MRFQSSLIAVSIALAASAAQAQTFTNESGGEATFYGQFVPTYLWADDGEDTLSVGGDNANSVSRLGFTITQPLGENEIKFVFESNLGFAEVDDFSQLETPDWIDWQRTDIRKLEAVWGTDFGSFSFGQGSMAADGVATKDQSGTTLSGTVTIADTAGGVLFRGDDGTLSDIAIGDTADDFDNGRRFRLRYDSPSFSGFTVAAAYGQEVLREEDENDYYDIGLYWKGELGSVKVDAGFGTAWKAAEDETTRETAGSLSVLHAPTGINGAFALGGDDDASYYYLRAGWIGNLTEIGSTAFSVDYYSGSDFVSAGSATEAYGLYVTQKLADYDSEIFLGYRIYGFNEAGASYEDVSTLITGVRYRF